MVIFHGFSWDFLDISWTDHLLGGAGGAGLGIHGSYNKLLGKEIGLPLELPKRLAQWGYIVVIDLVGYTVAINPYFATSITVFLAACLTPDFILRYLSIIDTHCTYHYFKLTIKQRKFPYTYRYLNVVTKKACTLFWMYTTYPNFHITTSLFSLTGMMLFTRGIIP